MYLLYIYSYYLLIYRKENIPSEVLIAKSLEEAIQQLSVSPYTETIEHIFVIGGAAAFAEALGSSTIVCDTIHLTRVHSPIDCDVFIPDIDDNHFALTGLQPKVVENFVEYQFLTYQNRQLHNLVRSCRPTSMVTTRHEEYQYLDSIRDIIATGLGRDDRTGVGTISKFGTVSRWNLRDNIFPLLTTKRVFWRGVAEELLWFIEGNTSAKPLQDKDIHIWDGNASREFLDKTGLGHREVGDLGPVYGFQWRHFGAAYKDMHADYTGQGVDQLQQVIHSLKNKPDDRRIILTAWNPAALKEMALPPCHMFAQFYVANGELFCQMYQRSGDMGLGVPFNIASYSLLTRLLAQVCGLQAGEFIHVIGDAHVYKNHVEPLLQQLEREPRPFPKLIIDPSIKDIDAFKFEHFKIENYNPHPPIKMEMAV